MNRFWGGSGAAEDTSEDEDDACGYFEDGGVD
jgi:hypothetical protein